MNIINNVKDCKTISWLELKEYEFNQLKKDEDRDIERLKNAIVNKGFNFPIYIWAGHRYVIDGTGRRKALIDLQEAGFQIPPLPIIEVEAATYEAAKALVLQVSSQHGIITQESYDAFSIDIDIEAILNEINLPGISLVPEINDENFPEGDPDEVPEVDEQPFTQPGDVYKIGAHHLMCGDATDIVSIQELLDGNEITCVFTDPPYGIEIVSKDGSVGGGTKGKYKEIEGDDSTDAARDALSYCVSAHGSARIFFWGANHYASSANVPDSPCWIIWDKQAGKHVTFADVELCWTNMDKPARLFTHIWDGFRRDSEKGENRVHPTQKPVKLIADIFEMFEPGATILDLFGGSGSTMVAVHQMSKRCFMMEKSPHYCDIIVARMRKLFPKLLVWHNGVKLDG